MRKIAYILLGMFWTGLKGLTGEPITRWRGQLFGFRAPEMGPHWERIGTDEPLSHTATNLIVEHNRLDAQRGAKMWLGLALFWFIVAVVLLVMS